MRNDRRPITAESPYTHYQRVGGIDTVRDAVDRLYLLILADPELSPYFIGVDLPRLKAHLAALLGRVLGGPDEYAGRDLVQSHHGMGITREHYRKVSDYLTSVLWNLGAAEDILAAVSMTLVSVEDQIVDHTRMR